MITEEKIQEVKKLLRNGVPEGELKEILTKEGYAKEDLDTVFTAHTYNMKSWYLVFAVMFLLIGLYVVLVNGSFLLLVFSALLFFAYYKEVKRLG